MIAKILRWMGHVPTLLFAIAFAFAGYWIGTHGGEGASAPAVGEHAEQGAAPYGGGEAATEANTEYVCPMHPQIRQDEFGTCPICFMDLVPVDTGEGGDDGDVPTLRLSAAAASLADVRSASVERAPLSRDIEVFGRVGVASSGDARITAWTAGRIERLYVTTVGESVRRGQRLARVYSPELVVAQETLIHAREIIRDANGAMSDNRVRSARLTEESALTELRLLGISDRQIESLVGDGVADDTVTVYATASGTVMRRLVTEGDHVQRGTPIVELADLDEVWVQLDIFEHDLAHVSVGTPVTLHLGDGQALEASVAFMDPILDPRTRTARARVVLDNDAGTFRPDQFVEATIHAQTLGPGGRAPVSVPHSAVLWTGARSLVYVVDETTQPVTYMPVEVAVGERVGNRVIVHSGVFPGERVVSNGAFRLDASLQIRGGASMMNPGEQGAAGDGGGAHDH